MKYPQVTLNCRSIVVTSAVQHLLLVDSHGSHGSHVDSHDSLARILYILSLNQGRLKGNNPH